jgi:predicted cupin superfamily sugar epimerase
MAAFLLAKPQIGEHEMGERGKNNASANLFGQFQLDKNQDASGGIKIDPRFIGATVDTPDSYALVGCSVAPGFDFADFEMAQGERLCKEFPQHAKLIARLTR